MDYTALDKKLAYYLKQKHILSKEVVQNYEAVFRVDYTHNSTAIEGNTLTLLETKLLLDDAVSPGGKDLREIYEVINHNKAFSYVVKCIEEGKALDKNIVKEIHATLMENIMTGGIYRNVNVYIAGARHAPPLPDDAYRQLECFYADLLPNRDAMHPIDYAAWTHAEFVRIHPFQDGNGRASRLLMNYQLMSTGYLPISIPVKNRLEYYEALEAYACENDLKSFSALISELEEARLDIYLTAIEQSKG